MYSYQEYTSIYNRNHFVYIAMHVMGGGGGE
jgi:hypothetical protein